MESNINYEGISAYCRDYSDKVVLKFFSGKNKINGEEIISLTDIKQVNLFVLMNIFNKWREEVNHIKSPYFNYASSDVQEAVENLMNVLSRNILVSQMDFKPILTKAVQQAVLIIFSPYDFYRIEFFAQPKSLNDLKGVQKFMKTNSFLLQSLIEECEKKELSTIDKEKGMQILDDAMEKTQETPEDFSPYIDRFSAIEPLDLSRLYSEKDTKQVNHSSAISEFFTLNDQFLQAPAPTLADLHRKVKIENIKTHITINQRFMFINDLFNGKAEEFITAVDELEKKQTFEEALFFLKKNYGDRNGWDMESETLAEFLDVVSKRY